ncbi:translation elongation factor-like protein [Candidatus Woesearchaeota archaeon]|nr:translation elongation factor-like protein [Candidatus Woesearchaeota archaeon]
MTEKEIGEVFSYYSKIGVAAIKINSALKKGDKIHIKGSTTDFNQTVSSMQIEHKKVDSAKKGDDLGIKVDDRVRPGDKIYKV